MKRWLCSLLWVVSSFLLLPGLVAGQNNKQSDDGQVLRSLLNEVRQLRFALQKSSLIAYRSQITIERIRAGRERVDYLTRRLEEVRNEITEMELGSPQFAERIKEMEGQVADESLNTEKRKELEFEIRQMKGQLDHSKQREAQLRDRETELTQQLSTEKGQLEELNSRIEALDRELETEMKKGQAEGKAPQDEKRP